MPKQLLNRRNVLMGALVAPVTMHVNLNRWLDPYDTVTPSMFSDISEMFAVSEAQISLPRGNYQFRTPISVRKSARIQAETGATLVPTFQPTGRLRDTPLIALSEKCAINYLRLRLDAGINTIKTGIQIGNRCHIGQIVCVSSDLNNNRTGPGSTDIISGAVVLCGASIRIGKLELSRFDAGWTVIDSSDVVINSIRNVETVRGGYVHGTRYLHVLACYTTGPDDPNEPNGFAHGRGIMTPGANSLVLGGCSDSSFSNWQANDMLEHAIRIGRITEGTSVPNHRLSFSNLNLSRPYGCGFKCDDGDDFNIKHITIQNLYTEDVGHGNWFDGGGYQNWQSGAASDPSLNNDGNKIACAIRNCQYVTVEGFRNYARAYTNSGFFGLWIERSNNVKAININTEKSLHDGVVIQSGGTTSPEKIELSEIMSKQNGGSGLKLDATPSYARWRSLQISNIDSSDNGRYGVEVTHDRGRKSPFDEAGSSISGFSTDNAVGEVWVAPEVVSGRKLTIAINASKCQ